MKKSYHSMVVPIVLATTARRNCTWCSITEMSSTVLPALLARLGAVTLDSNAARGWTQLVGHLASARMPSLARQLPELTHGEGVLMSRLDHHAPVLGDLPSHRRVGVDPRDRTTWFREVPR